MVYKEKMMKYLSSKNILVRKIYLRMLIKKEKTAKDLVPVVGEVAPLHFLTDSYYSAFNPTVCAYTAHRCGAFAAGINDYATLAAAKEFKSACTALKMPYTIGFHVEGEPLIDDGKTVFYAYGVSLENFKSLNGYLDPVRAKKAERVKKLVAKINKKCKKYGITLSECDIFSHSEYYSGGIVTGKHVARALAKRIMEKYGKGEKVFGFLTDELGITIDENDVIFVSDGGNEFYLEDLSKILYEKYCLPMSEPLLLKKDGFISVCKENGLIPSYRIDTEKYTAEEFRKIVKKLKDNGFKAVTLKTTRATKEKISEFCDVAFEEEMLAFNLERFGLPRHTIKKEEPSEKTYKSALVSVGNSVSVTCGSDDGFCGAETLKKCPDFLTRVDLFSNVGKRGL